PGTTGTAYPTATGLIQCSMLVNATFDTGLDGFILGQNFTPALYNTDANNLSQFQRCAVLPYMGPGFSGSCLTTGGDAGVCGNGTNTYGNAVSNNLVSPAFSLVGHSNARLYYNAVRNGKLGSSSCRFRVYISTNNGNSWNQIVNDLGGDSIPNTVLNREVSLASYAGQANVRLRFEFWDNGNSGIFTSAAGTYAGWSLDNVRVYSCP
ncbi:MAG TPA: hypothetical protein VEI97_10520, partial [bacterium]|nr:hypothetical protein [bacterium]